MGRGRRATNAVKIPKHNCQLKEGVRDWKVTNQKKRKKKHKSMKPDFLPPCYLRSFFFFLRGAQASSHTSSNVGYFQTPAIASGSGSQRMNQNIELLSRIPLFLQKCSKMAFCDSYPFPSWGRWM